MAKVDVQLTSTIVLNFYTRDSDKKWIVSVVKNVMSIYQTPMKNSKQEAYDDAREFLKSVIP